MDSLKRFWNEEEAATAVEYAVMLALIIVSCVTAVATVGQQAASMWSDNETGLQSAFNP